MSTKSSDVCKDFLRASQKGDLELLKDLVSKNHVPNWTKYCHEISGDTPLHLAAREGHLDVVKFLCESWAEPSFKEEVKNKDMKRPLHEAAQFARLEILEYLIERGSTLYCRAIKTYLFELEQYNTDSSLSKCLRKMLPKLLANDEISPIS